jgi:cyanophycin synthetase
MKILDIRVMRGPNYWSIRRHKLIVMRLDLEEMEERPTNLIPGFLDRMKAIMPSLYYHRCSEGVDGGFYHRVEEGTWMGHVIEHLALELQTLAGMDTGFGRTRSTGKEGIYNVVFSYIEEEAGIYAGKAAFQLVEALVNGTDFDLNATVQKLREIREKVRLGPSTGGLVDEAVKRGIPFIRLNRQSLVQLGYGINQRRVRATIASTTSSIAVEIACDKEETKNLLDQMNIPTPKGRTIYDEDDLQDVVKDLGYPLVLKPLDGNHGRGSTINIRDWETAVKGLKRAKEISRWVICERYIEGDDYRLLVINYRFVAAAKRTPAAVVGDGVSNIQQLIDQVNTDPRRGFGHEKVLTTIKVDQETMRILEKRGLTLESVIPAGEQLLLKRTANLSTGGTSTDVTDNVHPYNVFTAERIARVIGLDICGIDIMSTDLSVPLVDNGACVLEVNAAPGFRMHLAPSEGLPRNVAEPVIDMLYPPGSSSHIPIIAITGTNGKTTTTRLTAHIMKQQGYKVGFTTSDGIYIQNRLLEKGDCTGPKSAEFVLMDPTVDFAVFECARGGMLRSGLGFSQCDVGIVTNIAADHLGLQDIYTVEEMAKVKGIIPETVKPSGFAILNADDELVYNMRDALECRVALFSLDENNAHIKTHCAEGGLAAVVENGFVTILKGGWKIRIEKVVNIPLTYSGKAVFMLQNILPAVLAAFTQGVKIEDLRMALGSFVPSPTQTPGRLNWFEFKKYDVVVDFAHNPAGMRAIGRFVEKLDNSQKVCIMCAAGDRRDEDIIEIGQIAGQSFDKLYIHPGDHLRGRSAESLLNLLQQGIRQSAPDKPIIICSSEKDAFKTSTKHPRSASLIFVCSDYVMATIDMVRQHKEDETHFELTPTDIPNLNEA